MRAYKHVKPEFAEKFLDGTSIKIGTLEHYRNMESDRRDELEGIAENWIKSYSDSLGNNPTMHRRLVETNLVSASSSPKLRMTVSNFRFRSIARPVYIFCGSKAPDEKERLKGYRIFEITAFREFCRCLGEGSSLNLAAPLVRSVSYVPRSIELTETDVIRADAFKKGENWSYENEMRGLRRPTDTNSSLPECEIINCPDVAQFIREI